MQCWMLVLFSVCLWHSRKETFLLPLADLNNIWSISRLYKKHPPKKRENGCWVKLVRFEIKWVSWSWKVIVQYKIQTGACTCGDFCWHRWLSFAFLWCSVSTAHSMKQRKLTFPKSAGANARCGGLWCDVATILYVIVFIIVLCQRWCGVDDCVVLDVEGAGLCKLWVEMRWRRGHEQPTPYYTL